MYFWGKPLYFEELKMILVHSDVVPLANQPLQNNVL